jgi:hypothetical protein
MSSPVALMAAAAVVMAGVAFFVTDGDPARDAVTLASAGPATVEPQVTMEALRVERVVQRSEVFVDVYNNSNITGLAGTTAERIGSAGWQVVGSDNWYGTIPATTIYYPEPLKEAAELLSKDLGVARVQPIDGSMSLDRLTLILTADFA